MFEKERIMPMTIRPLKFLLVLHLSALCIMIAFTSESRAVELSFPDAAVETGKVFDIPVVIDKIDNLAGVKVSLTYDRTLLKFIKAAKTPASNPLLHIVNSKTPGKLVIVMAGARGIKGENLAILTLGFEALKPPEKAAETRLDVKESQLMTDDLKDISHQVKTGKITILAAPAAAQPSETSPPAETETAPKSAADPPS